MVKRIILLLLTIPFNNSTFRRLSWLLDVDAERLLEKQHLLEKLPAELSVAALVAPVNNTF